MKRREPPTKEPKSRNLSTLLFRLPGEDQREELEAFRIRYEAEHGATDFKRRYTSTLPTRRQQWLFENERQVWFDGLPPFVQAFLKQKLEAATNAGELRGTPAEWIAEYIGGRVRAPLQSDRGR